jgi:hypothetical protein
MLVGSGVLEAHMLTQMSLTAPHISQSVLAIVALKALMPVATVVDGVLGLAERLSRWNGEWSGLVQEI